MSNGIVDSLSRYLGRVGTVEISLKEAVTGGWRYVRKDAKNGHTSGSWSYEETLVGSRLHQGGEVSHRHFPDSSYCYLPNS